MANRMKRFQLPLELLGGALFLAAHVPIVLIYVLGSTLRGVSPGPYWVAIAGGYLVMLGLALARPGRLGQLPPRRALDRWLMAFVPAVVLCTGLILAQWPLSFPSWDAHGFGAAGGEANALFLPWLHSGLWLLSARVGRKPDISR